jgi:galactose mutarotase-like enzyme
LEISFVLNDASLDIHYSVLNLSNVEMPFSIGAHPAFAIDKPLDAYQLIFDQPFTAERYLIEQGLYTGQSETVIENSNVLNLNSQLIENDAVVFKKPPFYSVTLAEIDGNKLVTVSSSDFCYWGFWSKPGAPFFCIEPWAGLADSVNSNGDLFQKEGIEILAPNEFKKFAYSIEFH